MLSWTLVYRYLLSSCFSSFGYIPRSGIARSYDNSVFHLLRNRHIGFHSSCTILTSGLWFLYILANTRHFPFFVFLIITMLMGTKVAVLILHPLMTNDAEQSFFTYSYCHFYLLGRNIYSGSLPAFELDCSFFLLSHKSSLHVLPCLCLICVSE